MLVIHINFCTLINKYEEEIFNFYRNEKTNLINYYNFIHMIVNSAAKKELRQEKVA